jgi:ribosomal protein L44E
MPSPIEESGAAKPTALRYRCNACGNLTRFDVFETRRSRGFHHYSLGGELTVEEEEVLDRSVERVVCRWCGSADQIEELPTVNAES